MRRFFRGTSLYLLILIIIIFAVSMFSKDVDQVKEMDVTEFLDRLENGEIESIVTVGDKLKGKLSDGTQYTLMIPEHMKNNFYENYLKDKVESGEIKSYSAEPEPSEPWFITALPTIFVMIMLLVFWMVFMQQSQGGGGRVMSFGKSKAIMHKDEGQTVTFDDVAGLKEEKEELEEVVDFLKNPKKYLEIGARIPKGVLLVGPPGTGKTYLSKAVAGEAEVPFFSISGSDFVEMFVGVGASRVRDLFEQAKKNAPCIVFIDEIDAVGRRRGAGLGGGHDEREQTLNQLLVEMDGFGTSEGIIVMAATNRPDILDPALLRPGRFDRQIYVGLPDVKAREEILKVHTRNKPLDDDVDLSVIAKRTPGFTPADLENLTNEAALLAARNNLDRITMDIIDEATIKVIAGPEKKSKVISEEEKKLTAYHEAGHAVTARLLPNADPVHMVTIIPRGMAGGFTAYLPEEDRYYMTKSQMEDELVQLLGGRAAEALVLGDISTGAQNDIERATKLARRMVTHYGMSERLGPMTYGTDEEEVFVGRDFGRTRNYSEKVAAAIDEEMRSLIDKAYSKAEKLLKDNINVLHRVAEALLEKETLDGKEFEKIFLEASA
ncbi:membrane protease FtsH catalytic subunit [Keratinibaculum paraultunense]|uniref:ATP-dependent zinc metalloprotease FtsH n=1 Tax=Keratinibaculum paraultunense TaxID=1278232 RepID=A0A4R3KSX7_9FIRM|nr:ATP-dependent zinc metalloprotease FtsH [Keratinibaculum paraultunense]QQY79481.1 ATP-dependent zinc metalloprotease FtsH [Keratinibaculum paraultunense]TCS88025.1 membrane protease FtsH catalytic subunit [Keratinibaculum paraultunense]